MITYTDQQTGKQIATTIYHQLGANMFMAMTGSCNLVARERGLQLFLANNKSGARVLQIDLQANDTYIMRFIAYTDLPDYKVDEYSDVYFDQLQDIFTEHTGLYTTL